MSQLKRILLIDADETFTTALKSANLEDKIQVFHLSDIPENNPQSSQNMDIEYDLVLIHEDLVRGEDCNVLPDLGQARDTTSLAVLASDPDPGEHLRILRMGASEYLYCRDGSYDFVISQILQILGVENLGFTDRLTYLLDIFYEIPRFQSIPDIFEFMIYSSTRIMSVERSSLFLLDEAGTELYTLVAEGAKEIRIPVEKGIAGAVARNRETILIEDPYNDSRFNPEVDKKTGFRTRNILCMPMVTVSGRVVGVIQVLNKIGDPFNKDDEKILTAFCSHAAMSIEAIQLRIALQASLENAQNYNESIVTTVPLGLLTLTGTGEICSSNPAFDQFFQCPSPEGNLIYDLFDREETNDEIRSALEGVSNGGSDNREFEFSTPSGSEEEMDRYFHFHVTALKTSESERETRRLRGDNELEYSRLLATIEEISDRKKLLIGLQANLQALKDTRDQLVDAEKLSAVGKLAAGVAHEMNNPLTAVLTYSSLLIDKIQTLPEDLLERLPRFEERLKRMKEAATVCKSIADNLLSFSRQSREERIAISIAECIRLTQGLIHMQLTSNQVSLEMDLPDPAPRVLTNPAELQQVFTNLIVNAIHAIGSGGKIILKAREQGDRCIVEVTDNGPGIPPEIQQKIFDPFFTTKPLGEGTGLGLSIVYGIIQNLSGTIEIDSVMGEGTTFRISLPRLSDKDGTHE